MLSLRSQRVADLLIVVIKLRADENMVTYLRVKHAVRSRKRPKVGRKAKGEGVDTLTKCNQMH